MFLRRSLLILLVLAALALVLQGCASPAVQCGMRDDYEPDRYRHHEPVATTGRVTVTWLYRQGFEDNRYGESFVSGDELVVRMRGEPPTHNDVCGLARLGHEIAHGMKGNK